MCSNTAILVILLIIKILIIIIPIGIFALKRMEFIDKYINYLYLIEFLFLLLLISICIFGPDCVKNSTFKGIKLNSNMHNDINFITEESLAIDYKNINPSKKYVNINNQNYNFYNINYYPLSDIKLTCDKKSYFQNYGNDISAIATSFSTIKGYVINPYDLLDLALKNGVIKCDENISSTNLLELLTYLYGFKISNISSSEITSSLNSGKVVLAKTMVNSEKENLSCGENLIVIYSFNSKGEYAILNPSDRDNDYFCSSSTLGFGTIVKGKQNLTMFDIDTLSNFVSEYYVLEEN